MAAGGTRPVSGMQDHLPAAAALRREAIRRFESAAEAHGFLPLETPAMERLATLLGKYGDESDRLVYRVLHRGARLARALECSPVDPGELADLGLRYDLTVPLARVIAEHRAELPPVFRRYQTASVWRADRAQRGRFREFTQCDADITGSASPAADAEVLIALHAILARLGFPDFTVLANHRRLLSAFIEESGIPEAAGGAVLVVLDKADKIGREAVAAGLAELPAVGPARAERLLAFLPDPAGRPEGGDDGGSDDAVRLRELADSLGTGSGRDAARELLDVMSMVGEALGPEASRLRFAPGLARGLDYYTGAIFEAVAPGSAGSIAGGGRYDGLVGAFSGRPVPAVGISLGLERVLLLLERAGGLEAPDAGPAVLCPLPDVPMGEALRTAAALRAAGMRLDVQLDRARMGKQLSRAAASGARFALILGPEELDQGRLLVKDLRSGAQTAVPLADAPRLVAATGSG